MDFLWFFVGAAVGGLLVWLLSRVQGATMRATLEAKLNSAEDTRHKLDETFRSLAAQALSSNNKSFLDLAKQALETQQTQAGSDLDQRKQAVEDLVKPLKDALESIEKDRRSAYGGLTKMVENMAKGQRTLERETRNLVQALQTPRVRGRWGELTLHRVAELAGMVEHCDFTEQQSVEAESGRQRPDMVVHLPNDRQIVVDAKTPLDAYIRAIEAETDEARAVELKRHAEQVNDRVRSLARKSYWTLFDATPKFVVLFLPGEVFLGAALEEDPELLERALKDRVVLATPTTVIALLHAVAYGWRQEKLTQNARVISELGREIYDRVVVWSRHLDKLGGALGNAVKAFNDSVGSVEHRVLVSARRIKELGISTDMVVPEIDTVDLSPRTPVLSGTEPLVGRPPPDEE